MYIVEPKFLQFRLRNSKCFLPERMLLAKRGFIENSALAIDNKASLSIFNRRIIGIFYRPLFVIVLIFCP